MPAMDGGEKDSLERRDFLQSAAGSAVALVTPVPRMEAQQTESQRSAGRVSSESGKADTKDTEGAANAGGDNPYTRGMADFVAGLRYDQIPTEVIERIKLLILD